MIQNVLVIFLLSILKSALETNRKLSKDILKFSKYFL